MILKLAFFIGRDLGYFPFFLVKIVFCLFFFLVKVFFYSFFLSFFLQSYFFLGQKQVFFHFFLKSFVYKVPSQTDKEEFREVVSSQAPKPFSLFRSKIQYHCHLHSFNSCRCSIFKSPCTLRRLRENKIHNLIDFESWLTHFVQVILP